MATKTKKTATTKEKPPAQKKLEAGFPDAADKPLADAMARMALRPSVNAAVVMSEYTQPLGEQDLGALVDMLAEGIGKLAEGDLARCEAMLFGQAHALQAIFMNLARRATKQEYLKQWEAYLRMALKAQNQCRMTLETLATIKNPPVVIARQANINNGGQQQVNNGNALTEMRASAGAHAANSSTEQNELLEARHGERLDTRTTSPTSSAHQELETVEAVDRPKD